MMRGFVLGFLATIAVVLVGFYLVLTNGLILAGGDTRPSWAEVWATKTSLRASLLREAPKEPNPVALTDANLIAGIQLYGTHCAFCHGLAKGAAAASAVAKGLNPPPPQLATNGVENDPEGITFWKIKHGIRWTGMPFWAGTLNDEQIWTLALFLKHMDKLPAAAQQVWQNVNK
jgi:mono/diheme cytochrome c family protein